MEIYSVGIDELDFAEYENEFQWVVYEYEEGYYDGDGECIAFGLDGLLHYKNLSHCSCFGPLEPGWSKRSDWHTLTIEEFLQEKESIHDFDCGDIVKSKVLSLLKK